MNTAQPNEKLSTSVHHIQESIWVLIFRISVPLFIFSTIYAGLLVFSLYTNIIATYGETLVIGVLWVIHTALFIIELSIVLSVALQWATHDYYISEYNLISFSGIFKKGEHLYELDHIRAVELKQGVWGRIFRYGDIKLSLGARGFSQVLTLKNISNPKKYERIFGRHLRAPSSV